MAPHLSGCRWSLGGGSVLVLPVRRGFVISLFLFVRSQVVTQPSLRCEIAGGWPAKESHPHRPGVFSTSSGKLVLKIFSQLGLSGSTTYRLMQSPSRAFLASSPFRDCAANCQYWGEGIG